MDLDTVQVVSWDVDGTLYASWHMKRHLFARLLAECLHGRGAAAWRELVALQHLRKRIEAARSAAGRVAPSAQPPDLPPLQELERRWYGGAIGRTGLQPGVLALLDYFDQRGLPQVIFSDYAAADKIAVLGIADRFAAVYAGIELGAVKPSPTGLLQIAADFQIPLTSILHIGDRLDTDGAAAQAAGCPCLILGRDFTSFTELFRWLDEKT